MKTYKTPIILIVSIGLLTIGFAWLNKGNAPAERALAQDAPFVISSPTPLTSDEGAAILADTSLAGSDEIPPAALAAADPQAVMVLPTPVPGGTLVYFVPTDNDATATVIYLYNTTSTAKIVPVRGFSYNGVLVYSLNINVGPTSFLRLASDSIAAAPPPSWATPAPIITNFTDFTYLASLDLPQGVRAEGYTLFNPGTGVVDPRADQGAIPLRFSTDPSTLFLPNVSLSR